MVCSTQVKYLYETNKSKTIIFQLTSNFNPKMLNKFIILLFKYNLFYIKHFIVYCLDI